MPTGFGWDFRTQYQRNQWENMEYRGRKYKEALYEKISDNIARITLNRPERRNALNDGMFGDLGAGLHEANDDPDVRVVIIRGAGTSFGAGHELLARWQRLARSRWPPASLAAGFHRAAQARELCHGHRRVRRA